MDNKLKECIENNCASYLLPFLWLHGEDKARIKEEIIAIKNSGINEFCAESRPYEDFCGEKWWDDFGFILETAKELDMRVWLLDDKKFPTGYANGHLEKEENATLRKKLIREFQTELIGPMKSASVYIGGRISKEEKLIGAVAYKYLKGEALDPKSAIDLTDKVQNGMLKWDIPSGNWRLCVTIESVPYEYRDTRFFYYIDMLSYDSCHAMIDAVYEPHFRHFKEYFGNTFAGFFSDEPGFLNLLDTYHNTLGIITSPYPWREDLISLIAKSAAIKEEEARLYLPALWEDMGEVSALMRTHYMEVVTNLYSENFTYQLGNWCREHGVMYIGHVIEDMGAHTRLAYGSGHYFRALDGQDMAGIDIVLAQNVPGVLDNIHRSPLADGGVADPDFFHYTLPKLAASHAHLQPLKKGRAMCEIFGAFGWAEGLPFMKMLADHMISSGVNYFVPHAFSVREEDDDCPPHFYNGGKNIQYPSFRLLMEYMSRCSHLLSGAKHKADVAIFYNAEGEWTGGENSLFYDICRKLTEAQIDFDIVPRDYLLGASVKDGKLLINGEEFGALIISKSEILPKSCLDCFDTLAKKGLDIIFVDQLPKRIAEGGDISKYLSSFKCVDKTQIEKELKNMGHYHISATGQTKEKLRFLHMQRNGQDIYLFSNDSVYNTVDTEVTLFNQGECLIYEPWENKYYRTNAKDGKIRIKLENANMIFVIFGSEIPSNAGEFTYETTKEMLDLTFDISLKGEGDCAYKKIAAKSKLFDITASDKFPEFSGSIKYETSFLSNKSFSKIDLGQVGEIAELYLNGKYIGTRINAPYRFDLKGLLLDGENKLEIIVKCNLAHKRRDWLSSYIQIPPSGVLGDICLLGN